MAIPIVDGVVRLLGALADIYNKWFGFHIDPVQVDARRKNMNQREIDEFNMMLAKAKNGDPNAQAWIRSRLSTPR